MNSNRTAKAIALGLTLTHLGPEVIASEATELSATPTVDRHPVGVAGSLRASTAPGPDFNETAMAALIGHEALSSSLGDLEAMEQLPEGSGASVRVSPAFLGLGVSGVPDQVFPVLLNFRNSGPDAAPSARVRVSSYPGSAVFSGPNCEPDGDEVICDLGDVDAGSNVLLPMLVARPTAGQEADFIRVEAESDVANPNPSWAVTTFSAPGATNPTSPLPTVLAVDAGSCPSMQALVSLTDRRGNPVEGFPPDGTPALFEIREEEELQGPVQFLPAIDSGPLSLVLLIDRGIAESRSREELIVHLLQFSSDLLAWNQDPERPAVQIALMDIQDRSLLQDFTDDAVLLDAAIAELGYSGQPAALYRAVSSAVDLLAGLPGRGALLLFSETIDQSGGDGYVEALGRLKQSNIPTYGFALDLQVEPMMAEMARASAGKSQRAEHGRLGQALQRTQQDLENQRAIVWSSSTDLPSRRQLEFRAVLPSGSASEPARYSVEGSACAPACTAVRSIEWLADERHNSVVISVDPGDSGQIYSIRERVPLDVSFVSVDDGGTWIAATREILWDSLIAAGPRSVSYRLRSASALHVLPPPRISGVYTPEDGLPVYTCGENEVVVRPHFPVLTDAASRAHAYGEAWKHNLPWSYGPNPIPINYLTRIGYINFLSPSQAVWNPAQDPPWSNNLLPEPTGEGWVSRILPIGYRPGAEVEVVLVLAPGPEASAQALEEIPPLGWQVVSVDSGGRYERSTRAIRWGLFMGGAPSTVSYRLRAPESAVGPVSFAGHFSIDGYSDETSGQVTLDVAPDLIFGSGFEE